MKRPSFWVVCFLLSWSAIGHAVEVPFPSGRVTDMAGMLSSSTFAELESVLKAHEDSTSNQIVVLIIPSLEGESLEGYSIKVAETWKLGQKGKDNGVLLLVARDDRKVRIEVGRGLEGDLTDQTCGMIIRHRIVPRFRDGDFDAGVRAGVLAILEAIGGSYKPEEKEGLGDLQGRILGFLLFLVVVGIFTAIALFSTGFMSWFLYLFLMPFWGLFPPAMLGSTPGLALFGMYAIGFLVLKMWLKKSPMGMSLVKCLTRSVHSGCSFWTASTTI